MVETSEHTDATAALEAAELAVGNEIAAQLGSSVSMGVDIVEIARIEAILKRSPAFAKRAFSEAEQQYCNSTTAPARHYATRFAAKEAVLKALGTGFSCGIGPRDVEVGISSKGKPFAILHGRAKEKAQELHIEELPLSLSYTHTDAVACAMALTASTTSAPEKPLNQKEELQKRFKEVRSLLD